MRAIGVVYWRERALLTTGDLISDVAASPTSQIVISVALSSPTMKYLCASGTFIASNHFLSQMFSENDGARLARKAPIPFKSGKQWSVECEAVRLGEQVFAFFHKDAAPISKRNQLQLPWWRTVFEPSPSVR